MSSVLETSEEIMTPRASTAQNVVVETECHSSPEKPSNISNSISISSENEINEPIFTPSFETPQKTPMKDVISNIMESYKEALYNLTTEISNLREELADQKQHFKKQLKLFNQKQNAQQEQMEQSLQNQQQLQQRQQNQLKNQLKQQIEQHFEQIKSAETPQLDIQYETIAAPPKLPKLPTHQLNKKPPNHQKAEKKQKSNAVVEANLYKKTPTNAIKPEAPLQETSICVDGHQPKHQQQKIPRKIDAMLLGSSIVKHIRGGFIKKRSGKYVKVCSFPGAGAEKVADHAEVEMKYATPEVAIIHAGGNDLANKVPCKDIADNLAYLGCELQDRGVKRIAISGMAPRIGLKKKISELNMELKGMCKTYKFDFINNSNIYYNWHMANDSVHLNYDGVDVLASNYAHYLKGIKLGNED